MRWLYLLPLLLAATTASALDLGPVSLNAHGIVGHNVSQGTYYGLGADLSANIEDRLAVGVGGFYTAGEHPTQDREMGAGPFVAYSYPLVNFLIASAREDLDYIDQRNPYTTNTGSLDYHSSFGMASITSVALSLFVTRNLGISAGYRFALGLNNSDLGKDHSGFFFGLAFGI